MQMAVHSGPGVSGVKVTTETVLNVSFDLVPSIVMSTVPVQPVPRSAVPVQCWWNVVASAVPEQVTLNIGSDGCSNVLPAQIVSAPVLRDPKGSSQGTYVESTVVQMPAHSGGAGVS